MVKEVLNMSTKGTINKRNINGKIYYYHQYLENGKQVSKILSKEDAYMTAFRIYFPGEEVSDFLSHKFNFSVSYGKELFNLMDGYKNFNRRYCFKDIHDFLFDKNKPGKVLILYGLRRTGKTTLIFQNIAALTMKDFAKAVYIKCSKNQTFHQLLDDLSYLTSCGIKYIFIDEITLLNDFIALSSSLADIYGVSAKIVLSGTDSLGFLISSYHELYDRAKMIHTTYIPFKEFSEVLGIDSIDSYIEYGGTMSIEGVDYNKTIGGEYGVNEYTDSAIAHNIVHSLKVYKDGRYFSSLFALYERGELENVINRIVEDSNHRFAISVIENDFKSHDYGSLKNLVDLPRNIHTLGHVLDGVDERQLTTDLMAALSIINKEKQSLKVDEQVLAEIKNFLLRLDVYSTVKEIRTPNYVSSERNVFTQPGLRYCQAKILIELLLNEPMISKYSLEIINSLKEKLLADVKGKMIEDIVLLEASTKYSNCFKIVFDVVGEFDMAIVDEENRYSTIFEIKYANKDNGAQYKYLTNESLIAEFEKKYYPVKEKIVLYRGENKQINDIKYLNVAEYLKSL